ncbi:MAG: PilT-like protein [Planctomycetaceae bacterium]|nr:PilT-like protein [Planctomycetaceae bacterium]
MQTANTSDVFPITVPVLMRAADLWIDARNGGHPKNDADLIIAATALEANRILFTGNAKHYSWIKGLKISNWRNAQP